MVRSGPSELVAKVKQLTDANRVLEKEVELLKAKIASGAGDDLLQKAIDLDGIKLLIANIEGVNSKALRDTVDQFKNKLGSSIVVLATVIEGKVSLVVGVSKDLTGKIKAGELINMVAKQVGGKGGGRPDMAICLLYTSPSPRDRTRSRMPSSA